MTELSEHAPEIWWEDGELVLCRSMPDGEPLAVLTAMPLTSPPSREAIGRLQHAYKLRDQLDPAWAARPLRLATERGRLTLLSEDPGGELCVVGRADGPWAGLYTPMLGYLNAPEETAQALHDGVLRTGDVGRVNERGEVFVTDRRKLVIVRGGANVYPAEVERIIAGYRGVRACAVFGTPDERLGARIVNHVHFGDKLTVLVGLRDITPTSIESPAASWNDVRNAIGGGPIFRHAGRVPLYSADDLDDWVTSMLSAPMRSTSDAPTPQLGNATETIAPA